MNRSFGMSDPDGEPEIMTVSGEAPRDWKTSVADRIWARWRLLVVLVVVVFALNSLAGLVVGSVGLIAFANRITGRLITARRVVQQVREIVVDPPDE
jgi:hypothetical protein